MTIAIDLCIKKLAAKGPPMAPFKPFFEWDLTMHDLLERPETDVLDPELDGYPTLEEEEAAYAIPHRTLQPTLREEPRPSLAGCVPACWERWSTERTCRDRDRMRRSRFAGR